MIKHPVLRYLWALGALLWAMATPQVFAESCDLLFENPIQVHDLNGAVRFRLSSKVYDAPNDELITPLIIEEALTLSCGWSDCSASGTTSPQLFINEFKHSASQTDIQVGTLQSVTTDGV